jgi:3'(2'), 5'-bisphosphate nucleotidase
MHDYADLMAAALPAVADACRVCRTVQANMGAVRAITKEDASPVTVADFASQAVVVMRLAERLAEGQVGRIILVGEETSAFLRNPEHDAQLAATLAAVREVWSDAAEDGLLEAIDAGAADTHHSGYWTLDPIDGTKGFLRGEQYAIALAYVERGEVVLGVLGCPNLPRDMSLPLNRPDRHGSLYSAIRGQGLYELPADRPDEHPLRIMRPQRAEGEPMRLCASVEAAHTNLSATETVMRRVDAEVGTRHELVQIDSQCKYAVVARGQADAYMRLPSRKGYQEWIWDHAAGALIASEAGCAVTDATGKQLDFSRGKKLTENRGILCAPAREHGLLLGAIQDLGAAGRA